MNYSANTSHICAYGSNVTWSCTLSREYNTRTLDYGNREQTYAVQKFVGSRPFFPTKLRWCCSQHPSLALRMSSSPLGDTNGDVQQTLVRLTASVANHSTILADCYNRISALERKDQDGTEDTDSDAATPDLKPTQPPGTTLQHAILSASQESLANLVLRLCRQNNEAQKLTDSYLLKPEPTLYHLSEREIECLRACIGCDTLHQLDGKLDYRPSRRHPGIDHPFAPVL
jgi:hypothetical protein